MNDKKYTQLELPFSFKNNQKSSNVISFPLEKVAEKIHKEKDDRRQEAIKKGIEKCVESLQWYYK